MLCFFFIKKLEVKQLQIYIFFHVFTTLSVYFLCTNSKLSIFFNQTYYTVEAKLFFAIINKLSNMNLDAARDKDPCTKEEKKRKKRKMRPHLLDSPIFLLPIIYIAPFFRVSYVRLVVFLLSFTQTPLFFGHKLNRPTHTPHRPQSVSIPPKQHSTLNDSRAVEGDIREMSENTKTMKKGKAVIVGGSIAGVACAHALILAGWDVVVLEKSRAAPKGSPTGAGLGLDSQSVRIIESWLPKPHLVKGSTWPLTIDQVLHKHSNPLVNCLLIATILFDF